MIVFAQEVFAGSSSTLASLALTLGVWGARPSRRVRGRAGPGSPREGEGAHDARPTGKAAVPASAEKARTMRALRERPCHHQRRAHIPQRQTHTCFCATRHAPPASRQRRHSLRGLGQRPSAGVQRAGVRPLPQGTGARSPRLAAPTRGTGARGAHPRAAHAAQRML